MTSTISSPATDPGARAADAGGARSDGATPTNGKRADRFDDEMTAASRDVHDDAGPARERRASRKDDDQRRPEDGDGRAALAAGANPAHVPQPVAHAAHAVDADVTARMVERAALAAGPKAKAARAAGAAAAAPTPTPSPSTTDPKGKGRAGDDDGKQAGKPAGDASGAAQHAAQATHAHADAKSAPPPPVAAPNRAPATPDRAPAAAHALFSRDDVQGVLAGHVARLHVDVGAAEPVSIFVRTRDGVANVSVQAPPGTAPLTERGVRAALASEGLSLGSFDSRQGDGSQGDPAEAARGPALAAARGPRVAGAAPVAEDVARGGDVARVTGSARRRVSVRA